MAGALGVIAVDGGDLSLGGGVLALVRPALSLLDEGGVLALLSRNGDLDQDLPSWCRAERHEYLGAEDAGHGARRHLIGRGKTYLAPPPGTSESMPERADPRTGFAPRGAAVEAGGPAYPF